MPSFRLTAACLLLLAWPLRTTPAASALEAPAGAGARSHVRYLVLGAGPGGLQLAHYLDSAGRDYRVLERAPAPASFFAQFPRWRQLISINKRAVGRADSLDFAMRHDWNSLLSDASHVRAAGGPLSSTDARLNLSSVAPPLRFTSWSREYYPPAARLHEYLAAWAAAPAAGAAPAGLGRSHPLRVRYGAEVVRIARPAGWAPSSSSAAAEAARFLITLASGEELTCTYLIAATGLQEAVPMPGANGSAAMAAGLIHSYSSAPADARAYEGKRVLLLGHGNAAFEFAQHVLGEAAYVHVACRATSRLKLALETHYPGNLRVVHSALLETYNLKSIDGITSTAFERLTFAPASGGGVAVAAPPASCTHDAHGRATSRCSFRAPYDIVIACLGWRMERSVFADDAVRPALAANNKHPATTPRYESVNVPGLYFAGTLAHAADYRKASGGFIHGFRYTARALHRILEEEEADAVEAAAAAAALSPDGAAAALPPPLSPPPARWPATRTRTLRSLVSLLLRRMNGAAGPYQMFGQLVDVFVLDAVPAAAAAGFVAEGAHAAMHAPWAWPDAGGATAADPTGLADDVAALQAPPPADAPPLAAAARASQAAMDAALAGALREEVPLGWAPTAARRGAPASAPTEWLTLALEFGPSAPPGQHDPFALDRADVSLRHAARSHFLHPVLRYFHSGALGCDSGDAAACAPVASVHIIEDFSADWSLHTAHILPLARFLQHLAARRVAAAQRGVAHARAPPPPWPATPPPPPPFLAGVLTQLLTGCERATLFVAGAAYDAEGAADGWWLQMSVAAESALSALRAVAVHASDVDAPGVPLSADEAAHTRSVRDKWAAVRAREAAHAAAPTPEELPRPPLPVLSDVQAQAAAAARASAAAAYTALTARTPGLAVLLAHARSGRCRVLTDNMRVAAEGVRVFHSGPAGGDTTTKGVAVDVERTGLTAAAAAKHIAAVFRQIAEGGAAKTGKGGAVKRAR